LISSAEILELIGFAGYEMKIIEIILFRIRMITEWMQKYFLILRSCCHCI